MKKQEQEEGKKPLGINYTVYFKYTCVNEVIACIVIRLTKPVHL